jgi:hypothetical protein
MKTKKYKPTPQYKILAVYWWNPFLWLYILFVILIGGIEGVCNAVKETYNNLKEWDLT